MTNIHAITNPKNIVTSPEIELLLCCTRTTLETANVSRVLQLVQQEINWQRFLEIVYLQGVMPLLYWQLQTIALGSVPDWVMKQLQATFNANTSWNLALTAELLKLLKLFESEHIPVLALKGPVLAQMAYNNLALRQFSDLDILIKENDFFKVTALLAEQGYHSAYVLTHNQQRLHLKLDYEQTFWNRERGIKVDLHWSTLRKHFSFFSEPDLVWTSSSQILISNFKVETFSKENTLLFLCAHAAKHNWHQLSLVCDVAEFIRNQPDLNWDEVKSKEGEFGTKRMLMVGLYLAHYLLDAPLPNSILKEFEIDSKLLKLANQAENRMFQKDFYFSQIEKLDEWVEESRLFKKAQRFLTWYKTRITIWVVRDAVFLATMPSAKDKVWYWLDYLFTPSPLEWTIIRLPIQLIPVYYLMRPIRLFLKYFFRKDTFV